MTLMWSFPLGTPLGHRRQSVSTANRRGKLYINWSDWWGSAELCAFNPQTGDPHPHQVYAQETQLPEPLQDEHIVQRTVCTHRTIPLGAGFVWVLLGQVWVMVVVVLGSLRLSSTLRPALHASLAPCGVVLTKLL